MVRGIGCALRKKVPALGRAAKIDCRQELLPGFRPVAKGAEHAACHHAGFGLVHASTGHASMGALDDDSNAVRPKHPVHGLAISAVIRS